MNDSLRFIEGLKKRDINLLMNVPKADLHNHFTLGGNKDFIYRKTGKLINHVSDKLQSMDDMRRWLNENVGNMFNDKEGRKIAIDSCFHQASEDSITVLDIGENVWAKDGIYGGDINL